MELSEREARASSFVFVAATDPEWPASALVAALGHNIQVVIVDVEEFVAAYVAGIGVENAAALIPVEDAMPFPIRRPGILDCEIEESLACFDFFGREGRLEVKIEIGFSRGHPLETPAHAFLVGGELLVRGARYRNHVDVAMLQVNVDAIEAVGAQGAMGATRLVVRAEHEMVDDELAAPLEEIGKRLIAVGTLEHVILCNFHPGKAAALFVQLILHLGKLLFLREEFLTRLDPLFRADDRMIAEVGCHAIVLLLVGLA